MSLDELRQVKAELEAEKLRMDARLEALRRSPWRSSWWWAAGLWAAAAAMWIALWLL